MLKLYLLILSITINYYFFHSTLFLFLFPILSFFALRWALALFFNIEITRAMDFFLNYETFENRSHIIGCAILSTTLNTDQVIKMIKERAFIYPQYEKLKKVLKSKFMINYWTYADNFNFDNHIEVVQTKFESKEEIYTWMNPHCSEIKMNPEIPRWKIYLFPQFAKNQSLVIMKCHHAFADGISLISYMFNMGDSHGVELVRIPKIPFWKVMITLPLSLFNVKEYVHKMFLMKSDKNRIKDLPLTGKKNIYLTEPIPLEKIKLFAKKLRVGLNDVFLCLIYRSIKSCYKQHFKEDPPSFKIFLAASLREIPKPKNALTALSLNNDVHFISPEEFKCNEDSFENDVLTCHHMLRKLKHSYDLYFLGFFGELSYSLMPNAFNIASLNHTTECCTCLFSSVPGPLKKITFLNHEVEEVFFSGNGVGKFRLAISALTYNGNVVIGFAADEATRIHSKSFVEEIEKIVKTEIL